MAESPRGPPERKYSWWWDSHVSPKNSTWLQQILTDADTKVKEMIKLIEEDADSFARRAEMFYKNRPEIIRIIEELYRSYRALAEGYNKSNFDLQQAQRTMREAFPDNHKINDDSSESERFISSVKHLQIENADLREASKKEKAEKLLLLQKLAVMEEELGLTNELCESDVAKMFEELQYSTIFRAVLEEKFHEFRNGNSSKDAEIDILEKGIGTLEGENGGLKNQLTPLVMSLKDSISSLETRTLHAKLQENHNQGVKVSNKIGDTDQNLLDIISVLRDLDRKVKELEKHVVRKEKLAALQSNNISKMRACSSGEYSVSIFDTEIESELLMKDIGLDSESSSHELSMQLEKQSRSKRAQSWDSSNYSIDIIAEREEKVKFHSSEYRSSEIVDEKTYILERLNTDANNLSVLWITVQALMRKTETIEKDKKGKATCERDTLREQLEKAEEAIIRLSDLNSKSMTSLERRCFSSDIKSIMDVSEEIGRLQLEMQKIESLLMKVEEENESSKSQNKEMKKRVMLKDYLYGALKTPVHELTRKKSFCACIMPSTKGN